MTVSGEVVPFGKYKGQPVETLVADADYCEWLVAQPWFSAKYRNVYNVVINYGGEPQDSPEHNQMQARFLDDDWCLALATILTPRLDSLYGLPAAVKLATADSILTRLSPHVGLAKTGIKVRCRFEAGGWDVMFSLTPAYIDVHLTSEPPCTCRCDHSECREDAKCRGGSSWCRHSSCDSTARGKPGIVVHHCGDDCPWNFASNFLDKVNRGEQFYQPGARTYADTYCPKFCVELKPDLGDDYPSVLRQVLRYPDRGQLAVVVRRYAFQHVTWEQVQKIFAASGIRLIAEGEIGSN